MIPDGIANTWGIGNLEVLWKVVETIIDTRIKAVVIFHDVLHGLFSNRVTGMAIMDLNTAQEFVIIDQDPLLMVLIDIREAYDTLYRIIILQTLEGYGSGPKMQGLFE